MKNSKFDTTTVGGRIKELRKKAGLSQDRFAEMLHIQDRSNISSYETNRRSLSWQLAVEMAKVLKSSPGYILDGAVPEDPIVAEIEGLIQSVKSDAVKKMILQQVRAAVDFDRYCVTQRILCANSRKFPAN